MTRFVLLNKNKTHQLENLAIDKHQFHPVEMITDRICTVISLETSKTVDEFEVYKMVETAYNSGIDQSVIYINGVEYVLLFTNLNKGD